MRPQSVNPARLPELFRKEFAPNLAPAGIIANRVLAFPRLSDPEGATMAWEEPLRGRLLRNYTELRELSRRDRRALQHLHAATHAPLLAAVPAVTDAPTSMAGLERFAQLLLP